MSYSGADGAWAAVEVNRGWLEDVKLSINLVIW